MSEFKERPAEITVAPDAIITQQGKDFVLYWGLVDSASRNGLQRIETQLVQAPNAENGQTAIVHARVFMPWGIFDGIGDANPQNCAGQVRIHFIRMAETRAKGRAFRDALNVKMVTLEEMAGADDEVLPSPEVVVPSDLVTPSQVKMIYARAKEAGLSNQELNAEIYRLFRVHTVSEVRKHQVNTLLEKINATRSHHP